MSDQIQPVPAAYDFYPPVSAPAESRTGQRYWINGLLLLGTLLTMLVAGARMHHNFALGMSPFLGGDLAPFPLVWILQHPAELLNGMPFALTLIFILLSHEMGHYLYCVRYGVDATLPFFIPFPTHIGTFGAFIRIKSGIRSRSALFDIGIAGPIAGFFASLTVLAFSLPLSRPLLLGTSDAELGLPLVFHLVDSLLSNIGVTNGNLSLSSVALHPMAIAAWVGMFATSLNLLPGGQLDGGHVVYALAPRSHRWVSRLTMIGLLGMVWFSWTWVIWAVVLFLTGRRHPQVAPWPDISIARKRLSIAALLLLVLTFVPHPIRRSDPNDFPFGISDLVHDIARTKGR